MHQITQIFSRQRAKTTTGIGGIGQEGRLKLFQNLASKRVVNRVDNDQPLGSNTHLARTQHSALHALLRCQCDVGISQDDVWILPTQFENAFFEVGTS